MLYSSQFFVFQIDTWKGVENNHNGQISDCVMFVFIYRQTELLEKPHTLVAISTQVHVFMVQFV